MTPTCFPTAYVTYKLNDKNSFTVSAGRRLDRPNYQDLNPFTFFLDSLSYRQGNPYLKPQFSNNFELSHTYNGQLTTTLNYTNTTDVISQIINRKKGNSGEIIGFLTSDNIAKFYQHRHCHQRSCKICQMVEYQFLYKHLPQSLFRYLYQQRNWPSAVVVPLDLAFTSFTP
ncbi:MAG: TonB-dependent receptor [Ferruginibacter sp.]